MSKQRQQAENLKPGRNNISVYIKEQDRDFFMVFKIFCDEVLELSVSEVILRAMRYWVAHLPTTLVESWRKATELHFRRRKAGITALAKQLATGIPEADAPSTKN